MPSARATPSHSSPETELLFLLARPRLSPQTTERIGALLRGDLNWVLFVGGALSHDVLPLVSQRLLRMPAGPVPDAILDQLKRYVDEHVRRADRLVNELLRLFALLEARSISALTFKGPALAAALYGDASVRAFSDIDFLIHRRDAVRARDVVLQAGYHLHKTPLDEHGFPQDRGMYEYTFMREDGQAMVELHWRLTPPRLRGVIHVSGGIVLLEGRRLEIADGALVTEGTVRLGEGASLEVTHTAATRTLPGLIILESGALIVGGDARLRAHGLVYASRVIDIREGARADIVGAVLGNDAGLSFRNTGGTVVIRYDPAVLGTPGLRVADQDPVVAWIAAWEELP